MHCLGKQSRKILGNFSDNDEASQPKKLKLSTVDVVIKEIESGTVNEDDMCNLAGAIGLRQHNDFAKEATEATKAFKTNLLHYEPYQFETSRVVLSFLSALAGIDNVSHCENKIRLLSFRVAIDCLLVTCNLYIITPLFFVLNLIMYFVCGSKIVVNFLSSLSPADCYTSVRNLFRAITTDKIVCPSNTDLITFFNNNQVLSRNWRVRYNSKAMLSVITSVIRIEQFNPTTYQYQLELDPKSWLYNSILNSIQVIDLLHKEISSYVKDRIKSILNIKMLLSSPHLCFIIVFICDLFVSRDEPLMS